jgi:hypothetical protein
VSDRGDWTAALEPAPPSALAERLRTAVDAAVGAAGAAPDAALPDAATLADAALGRLAAAVAGDAARATALELLTADALLTYAFERAAAAGPASVAATIELLAPARFAALLEVVEVAQAHAPAPDSAGPGAR